MYNNIVALDIHLLCLHCYSSWLWSHAWLLLCISNEPWLHAWLYVDSSSSDNMVSFSSVLVMSLLFICCCFIGGEAAQCMPDSSSPCRARCYGTTFDLSKAFDFPWATIAFVTWCCPNPWLILVPIIRMPKVVPLRLVSSLPSVPCSIAVENN